jgi:hypothetical protein
LCLHEPKIQTQTGRDRTGRDSSTQKVKRKPEKADER